MFLKLYIHLNYINVKSQFSIEQAMKAQIGRVNVALLFL